MHLRLSEIVQSESQAEKVRGRLPQFLAADPFNSNCIDARDGDLHYRRQALFPRSGKASVLLLFGNPCAESLSDATLFTNEASGALHRVWRVLDRVGVFPESVRTAAEHNEAVLESNTSVPIGLASFFSLPSPKVGAWAGVAGVKRLLGKGPFERYERVELDNLERIITLHVTPDAHVLVFQTDVQRITASRTGNLGLTVLRMPPTRHIFSRVTMERLASALSQSGGSNDVST